VKKSSFPWILAGVLVFGYAAGHTLGLILAAAGLGVSYLLSLHLHPRMRHGRCNGTGERKGAVFTWAHRKCPGCQGGRIIRLGAGHLGAEHIQGEYAKGRRTRKTARKNHAWR